MLDKSSDAGIHFACRAVPLVTFVGSSQFGKRNPPGLRCWNLRKRTEPMSIKFGCERYSFDPRFQFVTAYGKAGREFFGLPHYGFGLAVVDDFGNLVAVGV